MDIDLNADLGEGYGPWRMGDDEALLDVVSSANIACGFHAGDPVIMERTVRQALARGRRHRRACGLPRPPGFRPARDADRAGRTRGHGDLPARRAGRHRPRGRAPHDAHELPRRAGQHGRGRRRAGRPAGAGRRGVRPDADRRSRRAAAPSKAPRPSAACAWPRPSWPTAPTTTRACSCRARSPDSVIHDEARVLARVRRLLGDGSGRDLQRPDDADAPALDPAAWRHARCGGAGAHDPQRDRSRAADASCRSRAGRPEAGSRRHKRGLSLHSQSVLAPRRADTLNPIVTQDSHALLRLQDRTRHRRLFRHRRRRRRAPPPRGPGGARSGAQREGAGGRWPSAPAASRTRWT